MSERFNWSPRLWDEEEVFWEGRPKQSFVRLSLVDLFYFAFFWLPFMAPVLPSAFENLGDHARTVWYTMHGLLLGGFLYRRFVVDLRQRRSQYFAITNFRAAVATRKGTDAVVSNHTFRDSTRVFKAGYHNRYVVFTYQSRIRSLIFSRTWADGPPLFVNNRDLVFLAPHDPNHIISLVREVQNRFER